MALVLTGTWEQALLVSVAQVTALESNSCCLGRAALQKLLYFLQVSGVPMRYRFDTYPSGPYCERIVRDVDLLLADGVLQEASANPEKCSRLVPGAAAAELTRLHSVELEQQGNTVKSVVKALLPFNPGRLEMLATLDYLYRQLLAGGGSGPWKERVIARLLEIKKDKFDRAAIDAAYAAMAGANLIKA
jgi:hypothetical protein